jgi:hypothetical protein
MTPTFCPAHQHWTDGPCDASKRPLTRADLTGRVANIDAELGDDEASQSRGFYANKALEAERAQLVILLEAIR